MVGCEMRSPCDDVHGNKVLTYWYTPTRPLTIVGCEMRSPSDDVHGNKVLTCWYTHEATDYCVRHTEFEASGECTMSVTRGEYITYIWVNI